MHFTHYQKAGDKVFAVNPFISPDGYYHVNSKFHSFETWLSKQPPIYADPSIKDGIMYKVDELEIVWQSRLRGAIEWHTVLPEAYERSNNDFNHYREYCDSMGAFCRQYATLKQPVYTNEEYLDLHGSADNMYLKARIETNEYFKMPEDKRRFYIRFSGQNEVYYVLNPMASNQPFPFPPLPISDKQPVKQEEKPALREWISVGIQMPTIGDNIVVWHLFYREEIIITYDSEHELKYFKHWYPLLGEPKNINT